MKNEFKTVVWTRLHFDRGIRGLFDGMYSEINKKWIQDYSMDYVAF